MAKRKRLTPAQSDYLGNSAALETKSALRPGLPSGAPPPIAQVAGDASTIAALHEVTEVLATARAEGRWVQRLPLDAIRRDYLIRDRLEIQEEDLGHLIDSIRLNGQRSPVEVAEVAPGNFGLISGFRRMAALKRLQDETGDDRYGHVLALVRRPNTAEDAYVAMVEENEVRLGLSYYERARIAAKAVALGVFDTEKTALQRLFASASRARRSKIGSFLTIYHLLDPVLHFPSALPERLGLALAKLIEQAPIQAEALYQDLLHSPASSAIIELDRLNEAIQKQALNAVIEPVLVPNAGAAKSTPLAQDQKPAQNSVVTEICPGIFLQVNGGGPSQELRLSGPNVGPEFHRHLLDWLKNR
ncbi:MAG: ParB/RepB/Spo0J family partition protein [Microgenomates group bacterium]